MKRVCRASIIPLAIVISLICIHLSALDSAIAQNMTDCNVIVRVRVTDIYDKSLQDQRFKLKTSDTEIIGTTDSQGIMLFSLDSRPPWSPEVRFRTQVPEHGLLGQQLIIEDLFFHEVLRKLVPCNATSTVFLRVNTSNNSVFDSRVEAPYVPFVPKTPSEMLSDLNISGWLLKIALFFLVISIMYMLTVQALGSIFKGQRFPLPVIDICAALIGFMSAIVIWGKSDEIIPQIGNFAVASFTGLISLLASTVGAFLFWQRVKSFFRGGGW